MHELPLRPMSGVAIAGAVGALGLAAASSQAMARIDVHAVEEAHEWTPPQLVELSTGLSYVGSTRVLAVVAAIALLALAAMRSWRALSAVALCAALGQAAPALLKALVERPRPASGDAFSQAAGFSFPSGHTTASTALFTLLAFLIARAVPGRTAVAIACCAGALALLIGVSRVALGVHYPTDVLAGWLTGAAIALAAWALAGRCTAWGRSAMELTRAKEGAAN